DMNEGSSHEEPGVNVSHGGLAFLAASRLDTGRMVQVRINEVVPPFEAKARVAWCQPQEDRFIVGVEFMDSRDAYRSRMVQQVCAIEQFQQSMLQEQNREVSRGEAAAEWIRRHAAAFPQG